MDLKARFPLEAATEILEVIAMEDFDAAAGFAKEEMLVPFDGGNVRVAAIRPVNPLNQTKLFEFFQGAVDGDQAQAVIALAPNLIQLGGGH
jgi:hypothetical protein